MVIRRGRAQVRRSLTTLFSAFEGHLRRNT